MEMVVIGGVAAGMSAASKIRRTMPQARVTVYEMGPHVSYGACGLPYFVAGLTNDSARLVIRTAEQFAAQGITVRTGVRATALDAARKRVTVQEDGGERQVPYDRLLVATGAAAILPKLPGAELPGVYTLKTLRDGLALKTAVAAARNVVVAGGGYIGAEVAESLLGAGKAVRLIEAAPDILAAFDPEVRAKLRERMVAAGMAVHTGEALAELLPGPDGAVAAVRTAAGEYPADLVVLALGVRPATGFLAGSGIKLAANGAVETDRFMRTSLPDVWAAGDCAMVYSRVEQRPTYQPLGTVANKCGRIAGLNMAGGAQPFEGALGSAAIQVCGMEAGRTGMGEATARELLGGADTVFIQASDRAGYYPGQTPLWVKLVCEKGTGRIVGGQCVGEKGAVLRVDVLAAAVAAGLTAKDLGWLDLCYAPPFSEAWDALNIAGNALK